MAIFFARYEAIPLPDSAEFEQLGGAYINCWIDAASEEEASELSAASIRESGWKIVSVEDPFREVAVDGYGDDDEARSYHEQAVEDGECYVFHQWPIDDHEDDEVH
jgi:hypothetical protein